MKFSILITTYNRLNELKHTLHSLEEFYLRDDIEFLICIDGSIDETYTYIKEYYPKISLINHTTSKGLIASRNELLSLTRAKYAISLDDDANFLSDNVLENIEIVFKKYPKCGLQAFSIYWDLVKPKNTLKYEDIERVQGFVGCGHVWNMKAWNSIPNYPDWFVFYGEEDFAAFQLFKKDWHIYYNPEVLVHHRVNIKQRSKQKDYTIRLRRSLRSGWYLYFLFYPIKLIPRRVLFTLWVQLKNRVFKGDIRASLAIIKALFDVFLYIPKLIKNSNRLYSREFQEFSKLPGVKIYWKPNNSNY